jgi:hypothetical protein
MGRIIRHPPPDRSGPAKRLADCRAAGNPGADLTVFRRPGNAARNIQGSSTEAGMKKEPVKIHSISAAINILAGLLWILAAFHPLTGEPGVDYLFIVLGLFFLAAGFFGLMQARK